MRRKVSNLGAAGSLLLLVAVCVLWVRSLAGAGDQLVWTRQEPPAHWGPSHYMMGPSPFPVLDVIEKLAAQSFRGRVRLRRVSWFAEDRSIRSDAPGAMMLIAPAVPPLNGVPKEPGLVWAAGHAMRPNFFLERREASAGGFAVERGFWRAPLTGGWGSTVEWSAYEHAVEIPHWSIAVLTAIVPAAVLRRMWITRRQFGLGLCGQCGYDVRATPERCPECGVVCAPSRTAA